MIESMWRIEFEPADGSPALRLLDFGDRMANEPMLPATQDTTRSAPINSRWARFRGNGHADGSADWSRRELFASPAAARAHCFRARLALAPRTPGRITAEIEGGEKWEFPDAAIITASPMVERRIPNAVITTFSALVGRARPMSIIPLFAGIPTDWINQKPSAISDKPSAL